MISLAPGAGLRLSAVVASGKPGQEVALFVLPLSCAFAVPGVGWPAVTNILRQATATPLEGSC
jgi:hypothetical protein